MKMVKVAKADTFCSLCGTQMEFAIRTKGFSSQTGEPLREVKRRCPRQRWYHAMFPVHFQHSEGVWMDLPPPAKPRKTKTIGEQLQQNTDTEALKKILKAKL